MHTSVLFDHSLNRAREGITGSRNTGALEVITLSIIPELFVYHLPDREQVTPTFQSLSFPIQI